MLEQQETFSISWKLEIFLGLLRDQRELGIFIYLKEEILDKQTILMR